MENFLTCRFRATTKLLQRTLLICYIESSMSGASTLIIPNDLTYLSAIQAYAGEVAKRTGFQQTDVQMILLALEEAVVNVVKHAFEHDEEATYQITFKPMQSGLEIIIKDKGLPYAPNLVPEYIAPTDLDSVPGVGLGSFLMRKSVDELTFHNLGRDGKEFHLRKHLPYKSITDYHDPNELTPFPKPTEAESHQPEKKVFSIRLMEPSESFAISRLFYRAYGYSYGIDAIYYPDKFAQLRAEGSIISVVTVTDDNRLVGHAALVRNNPQEKLAEAAMACVQPDFRGQGCQNQMISRLVEEARKVGLLGIYSKAVTNHLYAQKAGLKAGFKRCAVVVGLIPADRSFKGIHAELTQRESVAYGFLPIANPPGITLFSPEHHRAMIEKIYRSLGLQRTFDPPPASATMESLDEQSLISTTVVPTYNRAVIEVQRYGKNVISDVKSILKELCFKKIDQFTLFLSLEDPYTGSLCSEFEKLGFFFAGILPFCHEGDALLLQYLNNIPIDYSKIQVASEIGQEILAYVKSQDPNTA